MAGDEMLGADQRLAEEIYLGLRTIDGLEIEAGDAKAVGQWIDAGWAEPLSEPSIFPNRRPFSGPTPSPNSLPDRLILTPEGWLRLDSLAAALSAERSR